MIVANPIYDTIFKRLMENERLAKFFIATLIGEEVVELTVRPQEYTHKDKMLHLHLVRLDYNAVIRTASGELKNVMIEVQKAHDETDLMRFRYYLATQYERKHTIKNEEEEELGTPLPIITIYLLGFKLPEIQAAALKVGRVYTDMTNNTEVNQKSYFIERLTHDSYVVQLTRILPAVRTRLEELLTIFGQTNFVNDTGTLKELNEVFNSQEVQEMANELQRYGSNGAIRKELDNEHEYLRIMDALFGEGRRKLEKTVKQLEETTCQLEETACQLEQEKRQAKDAVRLRKNIEKQVKDAEKQRMNAEKQVKDAEKQVKENEIIVGKTIQLLLKNGMDISEIARQLNITTNDVEKYV